MAHKALSPGILHIEAHLTDLTTRARSVLEDCREPRAREPLDAAIQLIEVAVATRNAPPPLDARLRVTLLGRTKAGKSQLVAALTGDHDGSDVGRGRQRTTQETREHRLDQFNLIDTPGVAALGGEVDTVLALEAADHADAVLWVYAESLQDAEADCLAALLFRGKPVIVAFNAKGKVDAPAYRRVFEKYPGRVFRDLAGHRVRVDQVAARAQAPAPEFVAIHARAAWWAHREASPALREASRVQGLVDACERALVPRAESLRIQRDHDARRHRLIELDGAGRESAEFLRADRSDLRHTIDQEMTVMLKAVTSAHKNALTHLDAGAATARSRMRCWVKDHASVSEQELSESWVDFLEKVGLYEALDRFAEEVADEAQRHGRLFEVTSQVRERLETRRRHRAAPGKGWRGSCGQPAVSSGGPPRGW